MKILLIEDESGISAFIKKGLEEHGHEVTQAFDGITGLRLATQPAFDLIILDVIMPHMNGLELCKRLREGGHEEIPILMLTALSTTDDIVTGLNTGADDYLVKPFRFRELLARVSALARRSAHSSKHPAIEVADLRLDLDTRTVYRSEQEVKLTAREFMLLEYFMRNKNRVLSRVDILEQVWDVNFDTGTNVIDVYVNYLRNKIDKPFETKLIHTVVGMGYILKDPEQT